MKQMDPSWHPTENLSLSWNLPCIHIRQKVTAAISLRWDPPARILWGPRSFSRRWWHAHAKARAQQKHEAISPKNVPQPPSPTPFLLSILFQSPAHSENNPTMISTSSICSTPYSWRVIIRWGHPFLGFAMCQNRRGSQRWSQRRELIKHSTFLNSKIFKICKWCPRFCGVPVDPTSRVQFQGPHLCLEFLSLLQFEH